MAVLMIYLFWFSDIVFLIYVYQRYIYPVDRRRVNEFGISAEMEELAKNGITPVMNDADPLTESAERLAVEGEPAGEGDADKELVDSEPEPKPASDKKKD